MFRTNGALCIRFDHKTTDVTVWRVVWHRGNL